MVKEKNHDNVVTPAKIFKSMLENKDADLGYTIIWMRKALIYLLEREIEIDTAVQEAADVRKELDDMMESDALAMDAMNEERLKEWKKENDEKVQ